MIIGIIAVSLSFFCHCLPRKGELTLDRGPRVPPCIRCLPNSPPSNRDPNFHNPFLGTVAIFCNLMASSRLPACTPGTRDFQWDWKNFLLPALYATVANLLLFMCSEIFRVEVSAEGVVASRIRGDVERNLRGSGLGEASSLASGLIADFFKAQQGGGGGGNKTPCHWRRGGMVLAISNSQSGICNVWRTSKLQKRLDF